MALQTVETNLSTPAEQAEACGVTKPTILAWYHAGIIPAAVSVGRVIRFDHDQVMAALAAHARKNQPEAAGSTRAMA